MVAVNVKLPDSLAARLSARVQKLRVAARVEDHATLNQSNLLRLALDVGLRCLDKAADREVANLITKHGMRRGGASGNSQAA